MELRNFMVASVKSPYRINPQRLIGNFLYPADTIIEGGSDDNDGKKGNGNLSSVWKLFVLYIDRKYPKTKYHKGVVL